MNIAAVVLAAGRGTRFTSKDINKVVLPFAGKPIILYGIELLEKLGIAPIFVVVGFAKESVVQALSGHRVRFVEQKEQLGTGHALFPVLKNLPSDIYYILVVNGDDPFHTEKSVRQLIKTHMESHASLSFLTSRVKIPNGMGRVVRDKNKRVIAMIEEKDATKEQKAIKEVNGACYIFTLEFLRKYLPKLKKSKVTDEYYITELITMAVRNREKVETIPAGDNKRRDINTPEDLKKAERLIAP